MANGNYILDFLLQQKENVFFETESDIRKVLTTSCALGNTNGGTIVLGVRHTGETVGVSESFSDEVAQQLNEKIQPALPFTLTLIERQGKLTSLISVWEGADKPYMLDGQIYVQNGDMITLADSEQSMRIINRKLSIGNSWERLPIYDASYDDISENVIERFREQLVADHRISQDTSVTGVMRRLGFISAGNITNAGVVVTAKEPIAFFPQARIRVSVFGENEELQNVRLFEANLVESIDPIVEFIYSLYPQKVEVNGMLRQSYETLPKVALREGILNAVVHRRYDDYQTFMRVNVYIDHVEIVNSGRLPEGLTIDDLGRRHFSQLRNPDIANAFYVLRYIEAAGSGTLRIIEECKRNNCVMPEWLQGEDTVSLIFRVELPHEKYSGGAVVDRVIAGLSTNMETRELLATVYTAIKNVGKIKVADVQKITGKSYVSCKRYLQLLKEAGLVEYRGSLKTGGWYAVSQ
mgnify:FL=1